MRRSVTSVFVGGFGLFMSLAGQAIWRHSPDEIWAACAVVGVLSATAIACEKPLVRVLARMAPRP